MKQWWQNLSQRERQMVLVCGIFVLVAILYWGILAPIQSGFTFTRKQVHNLEQQLDWMQQQAPKVAKLQQQAPTNNNMDITTRLNILARAEHIAIKRVEPQGRTVQIEMESVPFQNLTLWLNALSQQQILVKVIDLAADPSQPGHVNVRRLELEQPHG